MLPEGYRVRALAESDAAALAEAYRRNHAHLAPWEPSRPLAFFTTEGQAAAIADQLARVHRGLLSARVLTLGEQVVGRVNLDNIVRGVLCSGTLGYWVDADHLRLGLASASVELACAEALAQGLHRVEAGTLLHNVASQRVLEHCGFQVYGTAPQYLFIDGRWQDHLLLQRILHDRPL